MNRQQAVSVMKILHMGEHVISQRLQMRYQAIQRKPGKKKEEKQEEKNKEKLEKVRQK